MGRPRHDRMRRPAWSGPTRRQRVGRQDRSNVPGDGEPRGRSGRAGRFARRASHGSPRQAGPRAAPRTAEARRTPRGSPRDALQAGGWQASPAAPLYDVRGTWRRQGVEGARRGTKNAIPTSRFVSTRSRRAPVSVRRPTDVGHRNGPSHRLGQSPVCPSRLANSSGCPVESGSLVSNCFAPRVRRSLDNSSGPHTHSSTAVPACQYPLAGFVSGSSGDGAAGCDWGTGGRTRCWLRAQAVARPRRAQAAAPPPGPALVPRSREQAEDRGAWRPAARLPARPVARWPPRGASERARPGFPDRATRRGAVDSSGSPSHATRRGARLSSIAGPARRAPR